MYGEESVNDEAAERRSMYVNVGTVSIKRYDLVQQIAIVQRECGIYITSTWAL